jgi:hypothetical protein
MAYSGFYRLINYKKYIGNPTEVVYRSLWERKFMVFCDMNDSVLEWGSETNIIPYRSPLDNKIHRYYVDFYVKMKTKSNEIKKYLIEIKPKKETIPPTSNPKLKNKTWKNSIITFVRNKAKWNAAKNFCEDRQMEFLILTEDHLGI